MRRWGVRVVSEWIPASVFLLAAILKAWHPGAMSETWVRLGVAGDSAAVVMTLVLVALEATLGVLLLVAPGARVRAACLSMLGVFTVVLLVFLFSADPPRCGCLGPLKLFRSSASELVFGVGRNLFLMAALIVPGFGGEKRAGVPRPWRSPQPGGGLPG